MEIINPILQGHILMPDVLTGIQLDPAFAADKQAMSDAYSSALGLYRTYKARLKSENGLKEDRALNSWLIPFLSELGFDPEPAAPYVDPTTQTSFAISHRHRASGLPLHLRPLLKSTDQPDLDKLGNKGRQSPHNHLQDYLNCTEHTYGLLFNGVRLRLLRDASRLSRASYVEWDLAALFEEERYDEFRLLYFLLNPARFPADTSPEALEASAIEGYHKRSLESGSRIREKLSKAIEDGMGVLANGLLGHPANEALRKEMDLNGSEAGRVLFQAMLRAIYRILFLAVVEERGLTHSPDKASEADRRLYYDYYSLARLRRMVLTAGHLVEPRKANLWSDLIEFTFGLYEGHYGEMLGLPALATGIWAPHQLGCLENTVLPNEAFVKLMRPLCAFTNDAGATVPINYGSLDVEELGSIYEGLLELSAQIEKDVHGQPRFMLEDLAKNKDKKGSSDRAKSGSHYTPESLVQPLLQHSLDHLIAEARSRPSRMEQEKALLALRILDPACGSGHILLSAGRRLARALAQVRTGQDEPGKDALRHALREVVATCLYGVDKNPMALELARVALWLETHDPGRPLSFLDHHLRHGDSLVGLVRAEELETPIPDEAYKALPGDDKAVAAAWRKQNKAASDKTRTGTATQLAFGFGDGLEAEVSTVVEEIRRLNAMPETDPEAIRKKEQAFRRFTDSRAYRHLKTLADLKVGIFFIPKVKEKNEVLYANAQYQSWVNGGRLPQALELEAADLDRHHNFLHWFLTFPDVIQRGGFDLVVGNPPFLGGLKISTNYGGAFLKYLHTAFAPTGGTADFVAYFFRRGHQVLKPDRFLSFIATNTLPQGDTRAGALDILLAEGSSINHAVRSTLWPGEAAVQVSLATVYKGTWDKPCFLNAQQVDRISAYLDTSETDDKPYVLLANEDKSFIGSYVLGKGFILEEEEARAWIAQDPRYAEVVRPYLNGDDLNSRPDQSPSRWVINFYDWPLRRYTEEEWDLLPTDERMGIVGRLENRKKIAIAPPAYTDPVAMDYPLAYERVLEEVKPERDKLGGNTTADDRRENWWRYGRHSPGLYSRIENMDRILVMPRVTKTHAPTFFGTSYVYSDAVVCITLQTWGHYTVLQSSGFEHWAWMYSSSMKGDRRFSPSDCFENFPFPEQMDTLEAIGEAYYTHRQSLMQERQIGLTKLYNAFHNPKTVGDAGLDTLRRLHRTMDEAVAAAYGWEDLDLAHDFYNVDYLPENDQMRYTLHPAARKEVLARLLKLNHARRLQEELDGLWPESKWVLRQS